jgi:alpha-amylase
MKWILFLLFLVSSPVQATILQLMDWPYEKVALECENHLYKSGFEAIQLSPVQEHVKGKEWWTRYQKVSRKLISRSGNREQFIDMISRCHKKKIKIYVDFIMNHMTGKAVGMGTAGTSFTKYHYPEFQEQHFHKECQIINWQNSFELRNCELVHLADLKTEDQYVQEELAGQMNELLKLGVDGFRIDAAKHIPTEDLNKIFSLLQKTKNKKNPYMYHEIIDWGDASEVKGSDYHHLGSVYEIRYTAKLTDAIRHKISFGDLKDFGEPWGFRRHDKAIVYITNHDTQRWDDFYLSYDDSHNYILANIFMLAWPFGTPRVMSSFYFSDPESGPPQTFQCGATFVCEHRWKSIKRMALFRKKMKGKDVRNWWTDGEQLISFNRGNKAFILINNSDQQQDRWFNTNLHPGKLKDFITGQVFTTNKQGWIHINMHPKSAFVLMKK